MTELGQSMEILMGQHETILYKAQSFENKLRDDDQWHTSYTFLNTVIAVAYGGRAEGQDMLRRRVRDTQKFTPLTGQEKIILYNNLPSPLGIVENTDLTHDIETEQMDVSQHIPSIHIIGEPSSGKSSITNSMIEELQKNGIEVVMYVWEDAIVEAARLGILPSITHGLRRNGEEIPLYDITELYHVPLGRFTPKDIDTISSLYSIRHQEIHKRLLAAKTKDTNRAFCVIGEAPAMPGIKEDGSEMRRATGAISELVEEVGSFVVCISPSPSVRVKGKRARLERQGINVKELAKAKAFLKKYGYTSADDDMETLLYVLQTNGAATNVVNILETEANKYMLSLLKHDLIALPRGITRSQAAVALSQSEAILRLTDPHDEAILTTRRRILEATLRHLVDNEWNVPRERRFLVRNEPSKDIWVINTDEFRITRNPQLAAELGFLQQ